MSPGYRTTANNITLHLILGLSVQGIRLIATDIVTDFMSYEGADPVCVISSRFLQSITAMVAHSDVVTIVTGVREISSSLPDCHTVDSAPREGTDPSSPLPQHQTLARQPGLQKAAG